MAIANQEGDFTLEANVTWRVGDGRPNVKSASLTLTADPAVYGDADVTIHASLTEVKVGEPVKLTLSATNSTDSLPMAVTLTLSTPPGWSLSGAGFAEPCAGHCIAIYPVGSGERKSVALELMPGQVGRAAVEVRLEWYFGGNPSTVVRKQELLSVRAAEPGCTGVFCCNGASRADPMATAGELTMGGLMLGGLWFLGRRRRH